MVAEERLTPQQIEAKLTAEGWSMTYVVMDKGGLNRPSQFVVTIRRNGQQFTIPYSKGSAHRRWVRDRWVQCGCWAKYFRPGKRVQQLPHFTEPEECGPLARNAQQKDFDLFEQVTVPEPPTLDEVMSCVVSDSSCVRYGQSLEEFCREMGYVSSEGELLLKGKIAFDACVEEWRSQIRLNADLDALQALFQDY